jgi:hypothetical protein
LRSKTQSLSDVKLKIEKLEQRLINDEIEPITYKKWFAKLSTEKSGLEIEIETLSILSNLDHLLNSAQLNGKHLLLNKVFEGGLVWMGRYFEHPGFLLRFFITIAR